MALRARKVSGASEKQALGLCATSDVITFDQNWHHLYSTSAGGKDLSVVPRSE